MDYGRIPLILQVMKRKQEEVKWLLFFIGEETIRKYNINEQYKYLLLKIGLSISDISQIWRTNSNSSKQE